MISGDDPLSKKLDEPLDAPPPYESVVLEPAVETFPDAQTETDRARTSNSLIRSGGEAYNTSFSIKVVDPVKQGDGVSAYVSYKVTSTVDQDGYRPGEHEIIRRFRDFTWLKNRLRGQYPGIILPALPEKNVLEKYKMATDFIEQRRVALQVFLQRVAAHPTLCHSPDLRLFLQSDETEFAIEASRTSAEAGDAAPAASGGAANAARKTLDTVSRLFRTVSHTAAAVGIGGGSATAIARQSCDEEENPEYLRLRSYFFDLEGHMAEVHRQAARLVQRHGSLSVAFVEFGSSMATLGRAQEESQQRCVSVTQSFENLAQKSTAASVICRRSQQELARTFEAPLKEAYRWVKSAKKTMQDRSDALSTRQAARAEVDARRARLSRLRSTPGIAQERVMEAERDLQNANAKAEVAATAYAGIVQRMNVDLERFQRERVVEMGRVLLEFAEAEGNAAAELARLWHM